MNKRLNSIFLYIKDKLAKKKTKKIKIWLNVVSILMIATGPFLMIIPGPQFISWIGLALFIYANYDLLIKFKWFKELIILFKMWDVKRKLINRKLLRLKTISQ